jgi:hypothetical protein
MLPRPIKIYSREAHFCQASNLAKEFNYPDAFRGQSIQPGLALMF